MAPTFAPQIASQRHEIQSLESELSELRLSLENVQAPPLAPHHAPAGEGLAAQILGAIDARRQAEDPKAVQQLIADLKAEIQGRIDAKSEQLESSRIATVRRRRQRAQALAGEAEAALMRLREVVRELRAMERSGDDLDGYRISTPHPQVLWGEWPKVVLTESSARFESAHGWYSQES